jgi:CRISPR/Cas system-associated exonuclease Cas4 (RecB family)
MENKRMISVSDINSWLYCPRKLYLQRICGLSTMPNRNLIAGKLKHNILENFSKNEEKFISKIDKDYERIDLAFMYEDFLKGIANAVFIENNALIDKFMIDKEDMMKKVARDFSEDIKIRIKSIKEKTAEGIFGSELQRNLDSVYISELKVESQELGLRGRVDRVLISRTTGEIIPFELKSREEIGRAHV